MHLSPRVNKRASSPFELFHSNVWGPCPILSPTGFKYFVTFVDDFSRVEIQTHFHVSIQTLRSDNTKEYLL